MVAGIISGRVINDINGNQLAEASESGLEGITLELRDSGNTLLDSTTTNRNGDFIFAGVSAGEVSIQQSTIFTGYVPISDTYTLTVDGSTPMSATFYNQAIGTIAGTVFVDRDESGTLSREARGTRNLGERGLGGVSISQGGESTTTTLDGSYLFFGVPAGDVTVQESDPDGYLSTTLNNVPVTIATSRAGQALFGDRLMKIII